MQFIMIGQRISLMIFVLLLSYHSRVTNGQTFCEYVYDYIHAHNCTCNSCIIGTSDCDMYVCLKPEQGQPNLLKSVRVQ